MALKSILTQTRSVWAQVDTQGEAMSWESVRNLERMKSSLLLVQNIISQSDVPEEIMECLAEVRENLEQVFLAMKEGEKF
jgi:hypothetical protein